VGQKGRGKRRGLYFFYGKINDNHQLGTGFLVHHGIVSELREYSLLVMGCLI
jgi:hypothetical protein